MIAPLQGSRIVEGTKTSYAIPAMPPKSTITTSLTPELTTFIAAKVASDHYFSVSQVVRAALRLLVEQDRRHELSGRSERPNAGERDAR